MPIGGRLGRCLRRDDFMGAGPVFDDHRLGPEFGKPLAEAPAQDIHRPARRVRHDQLDRPLRIAGLGRRGAGQASQDGQSGQGEVVLLDDRYDIRLTRVVPASERLENL